MDDDLVDTYAASLIDCVKDDCEGVLVDMLDVTFRALVRLAQWANDGSPEAAALMLANMVVPPIYGNDNAHSAPPPDLH